MVDKADNVSVTTAISGVCHLIKVVFSTTVATALLDEITQRTQATDPTVSTDAGGLGQISSD